MQLYILALLRTRTSIINRPNKAIVADKMIEVIPGDPSEATRTDCCVWLKFLHTWLRLLSTSDWCLKCKSATKHAETVYFRCHRTFLPVLKKLHGRKTGVCKILEAFVRGLFINKSRWNITEWNLDIVNQLLRTGIMRKPRKSWKNYVENSQSFSSLRLTYSCSHVASTSPIVWHPSHMLMRNSYILFFYALLLLSMKHQYASIFRKGARLAKGCQAGK